MTIEDEENYKNKIRDHCHIMGKYRGANSKLKISTKLPIFFHNLQGYDGHLIFRQLHSYKHHNIEVIPQSIEKYMNIVVNRNIIFLDSLQFLNASLHTLAKNLRDNDFKYLMKEFPNTDLKHLKGKDAYPYDWMDSIKKFNYRELPPKKAFYSSLNDNQRGKGDAYIYDRDYEHLQNI